MRGELVGVQDHIFAEIFDTLLGEMEDGADELLIDIFRDAVPAPDLPEKPEPVELNDDGEIYLPARQIQPSLRSPPPSYPASNLARHLCKAHAGVEGSDSF